MDKVVALSIGTFFLLAISSLTYNHITKLKSHRSKQESITAIMQYQMPHVLTRCKKDYKYSDEDVVILEQEFKRFMALSLYESSDGLGTGMFSSDVDNLWHSFLLFTKEYADFCHEHIGHFVHHVPELDEEKSIEQRQAALKDFQAFIQNYEAIFHEELHPIWLLDMCEAS